MQCIFTDPGLRTAPRLLVMATLQHIADYEGVLFHSLMKGSVRDLQKQF